MNIQFQPQKNLFARLTEQYYDTVQMATDRLGDSISLKRIHSLQELNVTVSITMKQRIPCTKDIIPCKGKKFGDSSAKIKFINCSDEPVKNILKKFFHQKIPDIFNSSNMIYAFDKVYITKDKKNKEYLIKNSHTIDPK